MQWHFFFKSSIVIRRFRLNCWYYYSNGYKRGPQSGFPQEYIDFSGLLQLFISNFCGFHKVSSSFEIIPVFSSFQKSFRRFAKVFSLTSGHGWWTPKNLILVISPSYFVEDPLLVNLSPIWGKVKVGVPLQEGIPFVVRFWAVLGKNTQK